MSTRSRARPSRYGCGRPAPWSPRRRGPAGRRAGGTADRSGRRPRLLKDLFHATEESGRPRLVVLDGEAGVGKSRLAWEFEKYVDGLTAMTRWHRGRCRSYGDGVAFWALAEAVRARLGLVEARHRRHRHRAAGRRCSTQFVTDEGEREWVRPRLAVLARRRRGCGASRATTCSRPGPPSSSGSAPTTTPWCWCSTTLQHADDGLLDFLDHLLGTGRAPIFVLALARPGAAGAPAHAGRSSHHGRPARTAGRRGHGDPCRRAGRRPADRGPGRSCRPRRGHPAVRGRDGPGTDRPGPRRAAGRPLRARRRRPDRPRRRRRPRVAARAGRGPAGRAGRRGEASGHRCERPRADPSPARG